MPLRLRSGEKVINRYNSHLHNGVEVVLPEALAVIESKGRFFFIEEIEFGIPIGHTICVPVDSGDEILYAKRPKRFGYSRFVKNREPEPCSSAVVILKTADGQPDVYILVTAFIGRKPEPEPWDTKSFQKDSDPEEARRRALDFWSKNALVWGYEEIILGTVTNVCPWYGKGDKI